MPRGRESSFREGDGHLLEVSSPESLSHRVAPSERAGSELGRGDEGVAQVEGGDGTAFVQQQHGSLAGG